MNHQMDLVAGLVLAAGASTRMGKPKQLLSTPQGILLQVVLEETLRSDLHKIVLVLGHQARTIKKKLGRTHKYTQLEIVENPHFNKGISSSIISGLSAVEATHDYVMIILADMPYLNAGIINNLLKRYLQSHKPIGALKIRSRRSHPVIFSRTLYPELHRLKGDVGARALFHKYHDSVCLVEPETGYDDMDIDTPEDYRKYSLSLNPESDHQLA